MKLLPESGAARARLPRGRLPRGRGWRLWLVLAGLVAHVLIPLGGMPMAEGGPGSDICSAGKLTSSVPDAPGAPHDSPCCKVHCLSCFGAGGLPATPAALALAPGFRHVPPWQPREQVAAEPRFAPFSARAPPLAA